MGKILRIKTSYLIFNQVGFFSSLFFLGVHIEELCSMKLHLPNSLHNSPSIFSKKALASHVCFHYEVLISTFEPAHGLANQPILNMVSWSCRLNEGKVQQELQNRKCKSPDTSTKMKLWFPWLYLKETDVGRKHQDKF